MGLSANSSHSNVVWGEIVAASALHFDTKYNVHICSIAPQD